ncbi:MAG: sigma-70 family RNA polymerase sigma factor [Pseudomonadota bacterium]
MKIAPADRARLLELIQRIAHGEQAAIGELFDRTSPQLYGLLLRMLKQPTIAQEALQDAYIRVWRRAETYSPAKGEPLQWLLGIARYRALDILQSHRQQELRLDDDPEALAKLVSVLPDPGDSAEQQDRLQRVLECLQTLPDEQRKSVLMAYYHGYSHAELAARLGVPLGTAKAWVRRGLKRLRICMEQP